jgi:hypothetical protein
MFEKDIKKIYQFNPIKNYDKFEGPDKKSLHIKQ